MLHLPAGCADDPAFTNKPLVFQGDICDRSAMHWTASEAVLCASSFALPLWRPPPVYQVLSVLDLWCCQSIGMSTGPLLRLASHCFIILLHGASTSSLYWELEAIGILCVNFNACCLLLIAEVFAMENVVSFLFLFRQSDKLILGDFCLSLSG